MPSCRATASAVRLRIAGEHHDAHARALERRDRFRRAFLDRVGDRGDARAPCRPRRRTRPSWLRARQASARASQRCVSMPRCARKARLPTSTRLPSMSACTPRPLTASNAPAGRGVRPRALAPSTIAMRDRMLGKLLHARDQRQRFILRNALGDEIGQRGTAERQRAGLVHHHRVDVAHALDRLGIAEQDARARALPHRHGHRDGRGETDGTGAGDDQHGNGVQKRVGESRLRTEEPPRERRHDGDGDHDLDEVRRDEIGEPLDRRARALRLAHHVNDAREQRVRAHALGADDERAVAVHRRAGDLVARAPWRPAPARR